VSRSRSADLLTSLVFLAALAASPLHAQDTEQIRCGFLVDAERIRASKIGAGIQADRSRPTLADEEFAESADGRFRIHYTRTGIDAVPLTDVNADGVPDYVATTLRAMDTAFIAGREHGGDIDLPNDGMAGGSPALDVYLRDLSKAGPAGSGYYGETVVDSLVKGGSNERFPRFTTWMEVDNDFSPNDFNAQGKQAFNTFGEDALRVTCVHEYHHVIQVGGYGDAGIQLMMYEFMSVWMELYCYPHIHDWTFWARRFFEVPEAHPLSDPRANNGYIWGWFVGSYQPATTSADLITGALEQIGAGQYPFPALVNASVQCGSPLDSTFVRALPSMYHTGSRSTGNDPIPNSDLLPELRLAVDEQLLPPSTANAGTLNPFEVRAFRYGIPSMDGGPPVSVTVLLTWPDTVAFNASTTPLQRNFTITLDSRPQAGDIPISGTTWGIRIAPADIAYWISGSTLRRPEAPYPNPVILSESREVFIPMTTAIQNETATVTLYNVQMLGVERQDVVVELDDDRIVARFLLPDALTPGAYIVGVEHNDAQTLYKIVVKR